MTTPGQGAYPPSIIYPSPAGYNEPPPPYDSSQLISSSRMPGLQPQTPGQQQSDEHKIVPREGQDDAVPMAPIATAAEIPFVDGASQPAPMVERRKCGEDLLKLILCVILPPAAICVQGGPKMGLHFVLSILLCAIAWVPGMLHAIWYCFYSNSRMSN